jgi:hypothetical protein
MSNVAEGRAGCRRIGAIDQEDAFTGFGQRPGNGTAHYASANDGNIGRGRGVVAAVCTDDNFRRVGQTAVARVASGANIVRDRKGLGAAPNGGNIVRGGKAVPADPNDGDFVLAHLRLAHRGS